MRAAVVAVTAVLGCVRAHTDPPEAPPAPHIDDASLPILPRTRAIDISTQWSSICTRWVPQPLTDTHAEDERDWAADPRPCDEQPYRIELQCSVPCTIRPALDPAATYTGKRLFTVRPDAPGPLVVTTVLRHARTGVDFRHSSEEVLFFDLDQLELVCLSVVTGTVESCRDHALDQARPAIALAIRRGDHWVALRASLINGKSGEALRPATEPELAGLFGYSLADVLDVSPVPPGRYPLTIEVLSETVDRAVTVAARPRR